MAVTMSTTVDVSAYVEQHAAYGSDLVKVDFDNATKIVRAYPCDVYGVKVSGASDIVNKTATTVQEGLEYYEKIVGQLYEQDIIRNI